MDFTVAAQEEIAVAQIQDTRRDIGRIRLRRETHLEIRGAAIVLRIHKMGKILEMRIVISEQMIEETA